jgi:peptide/nickel transport system substrate-binding protein
MESSVPSAPRIQRTLVVGSGLPVDNLWNWGRRDSEPQGLVNAGLVIKNLTTFEWTPWMAEELPSIDKGSLQVNADGTMVSTWRLRPNITWHDGTPFDSKDFAFGLEVAQDPSFPIGERAIPDVVDRLETPDSRTVVLYYKRVHPAARVLLRNGFGPLPRHIMEPIYRTRDYGAFESTPYWSSQFIGTGPYRVVEFKPGESLEVEAYDGYFLGRAKIDRVVWRIISDRQVMLTNVLTSDVHLTMRESLTFEGGITLKERWEGLGQGKVTLAPSNYMAAAPSTNPWFADVRVRQALLHATDREEIRETLSRGVIDSTHIPLPPQHPLYERVLAGSLKFGFDPQRAEALLRDAGWTRGPDRVLVNAGSERMSFKFQAATGTDEEMVQQAIVGHWRNIGAEIELDNMPARGFDADDQRGRWPGIRMVTLTHDSDDWENVYSSLAIPTEANRWIGRNTFRWTNPEKERLLEDLFAARVYQPERIDELVMSFSRLYTVDLPVLPMRYNIEVNILPRGLIGPTPKYGGAGENSRTWNVHLWDWVE